MIADKAVAGQISDLMLEFGARLDSSVAMVQRECTPEELAQYARAVGRVMGDMLLEIMNPLYARHPELKPKALK